MSQAVTVAFCVMFAVLAVGLGIAGMWASLVAAFGSGMFFAKWDLTRRYWR